MSMLFFILALEMISFTVGVLYFDTVKTFMSSVCLIRRQNLFWRCWNIY